MERTSIGHLITEAYNRVYKRFRKRRKGRGQRPRQGLQSPTIAEAATRIVAQWATHRWKIEGSYKRGVNTKEVVELAWQARWEQSQQGQ